MKKDKKTILVGILIVVAVALIIAVVSFGKEDVSIQETNVPENEVSENTPPEEDVSGNAEMWVGEGPENVDVDRIEDPDAYAKMANAPVPKEIAENENLTSYEKQIEALKTAPLTKADVEEVMAEGRPEKFKIFKLKATGSEYIPNAIIVEKGDAVQLNVFSEKDTDIQSQDFNFFVPIPAESITNIGFIANREGTFVFYCRNQCLGEGRVFGHIVVRPRQ